MKISVLTPTYNRAKLLNRLYTSLIINSQYDDVEVEWIIMDDGSKDNTKRLLEEFKVQNVIEMQIYYQENQGKMVAINNIIDKATGDLIIECDSDDYFTEDAFLIIKDAYERNKENGDLYALCFLKQDQNGTIMGSEFSKEETTMFDLYMKEGETGEKALVYFSNIRKIYSYKTENNEKFVTEARMYHQMDLQYKMKCINKVIMICEYQKDGYSKKTDCLFKENPYGYFAYFTEMFEHDMKHILRKKRLYIIKHYILFSYLTKTHHLLKPINGFYNRCLFLILYIPGVIKSRIRFKK